MAALQSSKPHPGRRLTAWAGKSLAGLAFAAAFPALADVGGVVLDAATRSPVPNALVKNAFGTQSVMSDAQGRYRLAVVSTLRPRPGQVPDGKKPRVLPPGS